MIEKLIDYTTRMNGQRLPLKAFIRLSANACKKLEAAYRQRCESWFHDTYVLELTCTQSKGKHVVRLTIEKDAAELSKVVLEFSDVSLFQVSGNIVDAKACFPLPPNGTPIGQIMDIWVEKSAKLTCCILLENNRSLYMRCDQMKLLQ